MLNITDASRHQSSIIRAVWDGPHLLWSGVSHGATAPVIAMARRDFDEQPYSKGTVSTAACFYDGVYDMLKADQFWAANSCVSLHTRNIARRYYPEEAVFAHSCTNGKCACAPGHSVEIEEDTIVETPGDGLTPALSPPLPAAYAIPD